MKQMKIISLQSG